MNSVFIGGSRRVSNLNPEVRKRIDRIIANRLSVLIGDANGADKAVQLYLKSLHYDQVEVFCVEGSCRNNAGNWPLRKIPAPNHRRDFSFYEAKDKVMAEEASLGFMIWDGKSIGTLMNVFRLVSQHKTVVVYAVPFKEFFNLRDEIEWEDFLARFGNDLRRRIESRFYNGNRLTVLSGQESLFLGEPKGDEGIQEGAGGQAMKYDKEENAIVDAYEKGKMKLSTPSKKEIQAIKATAKKHWLRTDE